MSRLVEARFEEAIAVCLLAAMALLTGAQVFMRYAMSASLSWSEELARYMFIWMTYVGIAYAIRQDSHIQVSAVSDLLSRVNQLRLRILTHAICGVFALFVMYQGWLVVEKIFRFQQKSASLGIPMAFVYLAPVTGFALSLLRLAQAGVRCLRDLRAQGAA